MESDSDDWWDDSDYDSYQEEKDSGDDEEVEGYTKESLWAKYKEASKQRTQQTE